MAKGFLYLVVVMDWYSRHVLAWRLWNSLDVRCCLEALEEALAQGTPEIFNSDQGVQFTSKEFTGRLEEAGVLISMDGRGRCLDNVFVERLWRTVKYEEIYLHAYNTVSDVRAGLARYFTFFNQRRPHEALTRCTPDAVYFRALPTTATAPRALPLIPAA